jgi:hypothetical protein
VNTFAVVEGLLSSLDETGLNLPSDLEIVEAEGRNP